MPDLFEMIIVWKLDRFARNRYDSARYKNVLKKNGVRLTSATEVISPHSEGVLLESVLEGYAEYFSADLSEKVIRGMTENALKCKYNGVALPIGYVIDSEQHFKADLLIAPLVAESFQMYADGKTIREIRDYMNQKGMKTFRGSTINYNNIQTMLHNRRYTGEYRYRDTVIPDGIPAIVSMELFDRVQAKLAKNHKSPARHKAEEDYILTTKLFCGRCGAMVFGESGTGKCGNIYRYYKCANAKKRRTCEKKPVHKEWLEDLVVNSVLELIRDDNTVEAIVAMLMEQLHQENTDLPRYEHQLSEVNTAIGNLLNAIQMGILTPSTKKRLEELEASKEDLKAKIAKEKLAKPKITEEFLTFWLHRFQEMNPERREDRKMLVDTFVNVIYLYDDKLVITFNYKDSEKIIDLTTINESSSKGSNIKMGATP